MEIVKLINHFFYMKNGVKQFVDRNTSVININKENKPSQINEDKKKSSISIKYLNELNSFVFIFNHKKEFYEKTFFPDDADIESESDQKIHKIYKLEVVESNPSDKDDEDEGGLTRRYDYLIKSKRKKRIFQKVKFLISPVGRN